MPCSVFSALTIDSDDFKIEIEIMPHLMKNYEEWDLIEKKIPTSGLIHFKKCSYGNIFVINGLINLTLIY